MPPRTHWLAVAAVAAALFAGGPDAPARAQPPKAARAAKKAPRRVAAAHLFKVQVRNPRWHATGPMTRPAARAAARRLKARGWTVRVRARGAAAVVRYRMLRWRTRAVVAGHARAHRVANVLRARGFQARVLQIK